MMLELMGSRRAKDWYVGNENRIALVIPPSTDIHGAKRIARWLAGMQPPLHSKGCMGCIHPLQEGGWAVACYLTRCTGRGTTLEAAALDLRSQLEKLKVLFSAILLSDPAPVPA